MYKNCSPHSRGTFHATHGEKDRKTLCGKDCYGYYPLGELDFDTDPLNPYFCERCRKVAFGESRMEALQRGNAQ